MKFFFCTFIYFWLWTRGDDSINKNVCHQFPNQRLHPNVKTGYEFYETHLEVNRYSKDECVPHLKINLWIMGDKKYSSLIIKIKEFIKTFRSQLLLLFNFPVYNENNFLLKTFYEKFQIFQEIIRKSFS